MKLSCEISSKLSKQLFCARHLHKVRLEDVKRVETRDSTFACSPLRYCSLLDSALLFSHRFLSVSLPFSLESGCQSAVPFITCLYIMCIYIYIYIYTYVCVCVCVLCFKWGLKSLITRDSHLALQPLLMDSATKAAPRRELTRKSSRKSYPLQDLLAYKSRILDCNDFWLSFQTIYILFGILETFFQVWDSSLIYTGQWFP